MLTPSPSAAPAAAPTIAIVGAGFSGALLALNLLRRGPPDLRISLIEKHAGFGRGLAYAAHSPWRLLNVRVSNMSAWPDEPDHLARWLADQGEPHARAQFITRETFGRYVASLLQAAVADPDGACRLVLEHDEAVAAEATEAGFTVRLAMGRSLAVDRVVLATGHAPPADPPGVGLKALDKTRYAHDPWTPSALQGLEPDASVLLLGSGLTMVDLALDLDAAGCRGPVLALSRRGLSPHRHSGPVRLETPPEPDPGLPLSRRLLRMRRQAEAVGWREAVDALRPFTQQLWRKASLDERRRFLRHLAPWWEAHRHRMAPAVAEWLETRQAEGRVQIRAGRLLKAEATDDGVAVTWRPRGEVEPSHMTVARIINCTGPSRDPQAAPDALTRGLLAAGLARPDPLRLGLEVEADGRVVDAAGRPSDRLYAVGPITRAALWEITAVPDIRNQVAETAATIAGVISAQSRGR